MTPGEAPAVIVAAQLIDGTGAPPQPEQALVIRDGRIEAVLPASALTRTQREAGPVWEYEGTTLPGLIDTHVHLTFNAAGTHEEVCRGLFESSPAELKRLAFANARAHLAGGVTALRDVGGPGWLTLEVRDAFRSGDPGPRMQASGPAITTPRGHLHYLGAVAATAEEVRARAAEVLDHGADLVKICATGGIMTAGSDPMLSQYTEAELRAAVEVADARGKLVAAHVLAAEALHRCVHAGVRSLEHCMLQVRPGEYAYDPDLAAEMRRRDCFAGFTFAGLGRARYREEMLGEDLGEALGPWRSRMEARYATERRLIEAGVRWVLHSDSGVRETPFGTFWLTLASAVFELGITPVEAIRAVTSTAAALLGWQDRIGTLEAGKQADLLLVDGDAAQDLRALAHPRAVLLGGRVVAEGYQSNSSPSSA